MGGGGGGPGGKAGNESHLAADLLTKETPHRGRAEERRDAARVFVSSDGET